MISEKTNHWLLRCITVVVTVLALIALSDATRRILMLSGVIKSTQTFDSGFARHTVLTLIHIIPGSLFMILGPLQFIKSIRRNHIGFHRRSGRIYIFCCYIIGVTALIMAFTIPIGRTNETAATTTFAVLFLFSITKAFKYILKKQIAQHREWMIRAFAIGLAISTVRPIVGMFFAFSNLTPQEFFGIAFWIGFTIHLLIAEIWINYTRETTTTQITRHDNR